MVFDHSPIITSICNAMKRDEEQEQTRLQGGVKCGVDLSSVPEQLERNVTLSTSHSYISSSTSHNNMFSGVSLSDRLKAAVTQLEATGSQLQAKAIAATSMPATTSTTPGGGGPPGGPSRPITPNVAKDGEKGGAESASTAHLAESALSGLRRSFNVARASFDGSRPGSTEPGPSSPIKVAEPAPGAHASAGTTSPDKVAIADATEAKSKQTDAINGSERDLPESKVDSPTSAPSAPVLSEPEPSIAADPSDPADSAAPAANIEEPTSKSKKKKKKKGKKGKAEKVEEKDEEEEKEAEVGPEKEAEDVEPVEEVALEQTKPDAEPPAGTAKELENDLPAVTAPQPSKEDGKPSTEAIANISKPDAVSTKATSAIDIPKASIEAISPPPLVSPSKEDDPSKRLSDVERRFERKRHDFITDGRTLETVYGAVIPDALCEQDYSGTDPSRRWCGGH